MAMIVINYYHFLFEQQWSIYNDKDLYKLHVTEKQEQAIVWNLRIYSFQYYFFLIFKFLVEFVLYNCEIYTLYDMYANKNYRNIYSLMFL